MTWITSTFTLLYYISLPLITIFHWLLLPLTPFFHLFSYILHALYLPIHFLAKFESLYIYFSIAALIGLFSGGILHLISSLLHSLIDLQTSDPPLSLKPKSSPSSSQDQSDSEQELNQRIRETKFKNLPPRKQEISKAYNDYWETSRSVSEKRSRGKVNLLAQTILEEEDSDDVF